VGAAFAVAGMPETSVTPATAVAAATNSFLTQNPFAEKCPAQTF
jgi:hypothetical protein